MLLGRVDPSLSFDALACAEAYIAEGSAAHARALSICDSFGARVAELSAARDAAEAASDKATAALDAKRGAAAQAMRDVKLVAARMVQDREAHITALKRSLMAAESRLVSLDSAVVRSGVGGSGSGGGGERAQAS
jgi:hypothetical protein